MLGYSVKLVILSTSYLSILYLVFNDNFYIYILTHNITHYEKNILNSRFTRICWFCLAGCPSKAIHGKVVGFDEESKTLTVAQGKKEKKVQVGSKTEMVGIDCPTKLAKRCPRKH